jgi:hypothetical protein
MAFTVVAKKGISNSIALTDAIVGAFVFVEGSLVFLLHTSTAAQDTCACTCRLTESSTARHTRVVCLRLHYNIYRGVLVAVGGVDYGETLPDIRNRRHWTIMCSALDLRFACSTGGK